MAPEYIFAFLKSRSAQEFLNKGIHGSVIDEITTELVGNVEISVPTSKTEVNEVVSTVKQAQAARQRAIDGLKAGVDLVNDWFCD